MTTIATLPRLAASQLSEMILAEESAGTAALAIIDVRDDDYIGGHIKGSQNWPSHKLDVMLPTLIRQLKDKSCVVFHCALSQQRGPGAALQYIRERQRLLESVVQQQPQQQQQGGQALEDTARISPSDEQKVYVLDKGFVGWQEQFGRDQRLTESYRKELWEKGW